MYHPSITKDIIKLKSLQKLTISNLLYYLDIHNTNDNSLSDILINLPSLKSLNFSQNTGLLFLYQVTNT